MSQIVHKVAGQTLQRLVPEAHVSQVDVSVDLRYATVWIRSIMQSPGSQLMEQVEQARPVVQQELAKEATTKYTPKLSFRMDSGQHHAARIRDVLDTL